MRGFPARFVRHSHACGTGTLKQIVNIVRGVFRARLVALALVVAAMLPGSPAFATVDLVDGANVYNGVCAQCHSANPLNNVYGLLNGANNPSLIETQIQYNAYMQQLSYLTTQQIDDVAAYLASATVVTPQTGYWWN